MDKQSVPLVAHDESGHVKAIGIAEVEEKDGVLTVYLSMDSDSELAEQMRGKFGVYSIK